MESILCHKRRLEGDCFVPHSVLATAMDARVIYDRLFQTRRAGAYLAVQLRVRRIVSW